LITEKRISRFYTADAPVCCCRRRHMKSVYEEKRERISKITSFWVMLSLVVVLYLKKFKARQLFASGSLAFLFTFFSAAYFNIMFSGYLLT
jgi:hypothetical protein